MLAAVAEVQSLVSSPSIGLLTIICNASSKESVTFLLLASEGFSTHRHTLTFVDVITHIHIATYEHTHTHNYKNKTEIFLNKTFSISKKEDSNERVSLKKHTNPYI